MLIGMMGAGKTTVGSRLARALDRPFVDSDVQVEQRTARTVREIFETDGEAAYRQIEAEVLAEALASEEPAVIAAAGGTILDPANRQRMKDHGLVVFLEAKSTDLVGRVGGQDHRPLLKDDPAGSRKFDKIKSTGKIDGIVGLAQALRAAGKAEVSRSIYDDPDAYAKAFGRDGDPAGETEPADGGDAWDPEVLRDMRHPDFETHKRKFEAWQDRQADD